MPEVEYTTQVALPVSTVWAFVSDMNNWAPFLTGYQKHEVVDATDSIWTLKGDVGILSRVVELRAHVTEWSAPRKVTFTLTGLNEAVEGGGSVVIDARAPAPRAAAPPVPRERPGLWNRFFRWLFRLFTGAGRSQPALPDKAAADDDKSAAAASTELRFTLRMEAGGPTGPLVNAMLGPALEPAVEDLATKIAAHLVKASRNSVESGRGAP